MEVTATVHIPDYVYRFYAEASQCIHSRTPEDVMSDALSAYAGMLSRDVAKQHSWSSEREKEIL